MFASQILAKGNICRIISHLTFFVDIPLPVNLIIPSANGWNKIGMGLNSRVK